MKCPLCGYAKAHKYGKLANGHQRDHCNECKKTFSETFDTLYYYRQVTPEQVRQVLQAHTEGTSLRGISRLTKLAYNTVVSIVRAASARDQMVHNERIADVETEEVSGDEMWSFVLKNKSSVSRAKKR